ncbi:polysaccharide lyase family 14 protein, partial [Phanerochaete carnosa HHB-10118-sp]
MTATNVLFPIPHAQTVSGLTTAPAVSLAHVAHVALFDSKLGIHKVSRHSHNVVIPPYTDAAHPTAWEAVFAQDSINPRNKMAPPGGFGFYIHGPETWQHKLKRRGEWQEVIMSYEVLFEDGWKWQRG